LRPIPVYHPFNDGWDYFDYLCEHYDRICFGNIVQADQRTRIRLLATAWERRRKYPGTWIHLLGYTHNQWINAFPLSSSDSSAWLDSVRWDGHRPKAFGRSFDSLPKNFLYRLGEREHHTKAIAMSAYAAHLDLSNTRHYLKSLEKYGLNWRGWENVEQNKT